MNNGTSIPGPPIVSRQRVLFHHLGQLGAPTEPESAVIDIVDAVEVLGPELGRATQWAYDSCPGHVSDLLDWGRDHDDRPWWLGMDVPAALTA